MNLFITSFCSEETEIGFQWEMYFRPDERVNDYGEFVVGTLPADPAWSRQFKFVLSRLAGRPCASEHECPRTFPWAEAPLQRPHRFP